MRCGYVSFIKVSCYGLRCEDGGDHLKKGGKYEKADDIVHGILVVFQGMGKGEIGQVVADGLGVPRTMGDGGDLLKEGEDVLRFQMV